MKTHKTGSFNGSEGAVDKNLKICAIIRAQSRKKQGATGLIKKKSSFKQKRTEEKGMLKELVTKHSGVVISVLLYVNIVISYAFMFKA